MIVADELRKRYGDFEAVRGVSFRVAEGEIFGLAGPNGAGKTTTLKMLSGLIEPTSGSGEVAGLDVGDRDMRQRLGFLPEESPLYENMTARTYLRFFADLYDVPRAEANRRIEDTLDTLELEYRDRKLGDVSKGMKRKVAIARSLVNDPDVLIYDEPTSGLDPVTTKEVHRFIRTLGDEGRAVIFSAHNLFHVESLCDRVAIMNRGRLVAEDTVEGLRRSHGDTTYRVYTDVELPGSTSTDDRYCVEASDMDRVEELRDEAERRGGEVLDLRTDDDTLEDIFLSVVQGT